MAEITLSKVAVFSPSSSIVHRHHRHHHGVSLFPTTSAKFSSRIGLPALKIRSSLSIGPTSSSSDSNFHGRRLLLDGVPIEVSPRSSSHLFSLTAQMTTGIIGKTQKWWEKGMKPNMKEITGADDLVESLNRAGDRLVVVDFFSPGCGGCKALHPKICQLAEMNPEVQFLQVNYEEHKSMCYSLNVHVLPFFRFYRGAHGRLCSFSCTNATIKKFKDALAKHSPDRCSLGPPKGLEEKELLALAANKDLSFNYTPKPELPLPAPAREEILDESGPVPATHSEAEPSVSVSVSVSLPLPLPLPLSSTSSSNAAENTEDKNLVTSGR